MLTKDSQSGSSLDGTQTIGLTSADKFRNGKPVELEREETVSIMEPQKMK